MYRVIMVPTDGTGFDREAIRVALRIADRSDAQIRLVRVLATGAFLGMAASADGAAGSPNIVRSERDQALAELYALAAECRMTSKADIATDLHSGPVAEVLEGYAKRHDVDLIVISSHSRGGISRLSLGSVTDSLIRHTTIPVFVVKPPASYLNPRATDAFRRIVVPLDGSALAEQILPRVVTLAKLEDAEITLLHVLVPHTYAQKEIVDPELPWWDKDISIAQAYLARIGGRIRHAGLPVKTDIVIGENVAESIGEYAARERANLIAIATHGRGGISRMLRGSVADAVTRSARTSMLVFHPERAAEREVSASMAAIVDANLVPA